MKINARVKELALQSDLVVEGSYSGLNSFWLDDRDLSKEVQRFAELIIEDIRGIHQKLLTDIDNTKVWSDYDKQWMKARKMQIELTIDAINAHFGIEG